MKKIKKIETYYKKVNGRFVKVRPHTKRVSSSEKPSPYCSECGASYGENIPLETDKDIFEEFKKPDKILRIYQEEEPESPREWDNIGTMIAFHNSYTLGDKTELKSSSFDGWDELKDYLVKEKGAEIIMPLYLYDHSGLRMKIGSFQGLLPQGHAEFDSGMVGFIYATKEDMKKEGMTKEKVKKYLEGEVETYDQYLSGDVYRFVLYEKKKCKKCKSESWEQTDAVGGFFGSDWKKNGLFDQAGWKE